MSPTVGCDNFRVYSYIRKADSDNLGTLERLKNYHKMQERDHAFEEEDLEKSHNQF